LRNPLSPIQTAADVLGRHTRADPVAQQLCGVIDRQVRQMVRLIDDLLEVSRITQGRVDLRMAVFDLRSAVSQAVEAVGALIASRAHRLSLVLPGLPVWVNGDAQRLVQAISNVLHNACKYTPEGGRIEVELAERDGRAVLQVSDNGLGIAPTLLPHLFDLFVQGERTIDRAEGGLGIGLTLVRSILERHAGDVMADSAGPGEGSRFTLSLPTAAAPAASPAADPPTLPAQAAPRRVLVVEDNMEAARMLTQFVEILGHRAEALADPYVAEAAILAGAPDLVLMDIGLPGLSGYELTERLRAAGYAGVVIAVSGYGSEADRARSRAAGFDQHWIKPVDPRLLEQVLAGSLADQATWRAPAIGTESKAV
jgi:CheY-like chemotaxis protein